ncbi:hypothetical protein RIF29_19674 [Crotalaria pallida]|uniref:Uncharacterized protein n=1 Tax=Crotalaria pallida TaxID=3830 RepID=A0AAN9IBM5_CROPI
MQVLVLLKIDSLIGSILKLSTLLQNIMLSPNTYIHPFGDSRTLKERRICDWREKEDAWRLELDGEGGQWWLASCGGAATPSRRKA